MLDHQLSPVQMSLAVNLRDELTFENFYVARSETSNNPLIVDTLKKISAGLEGSNHLIWGPSGSGLSHLMQAVCHAAVANDVSVRYFPLKLFSKNDPEAVLEGAEHAQIICLDNIDEICGDQAWEVALFHVFNRLRDLGHTLLISCHHSPATLPVELADLRSRLLGCVVYSVTMLDDEQKCIVLRERALARGMSMPEEVAKYILSRYSRDMNDLLNLLDRLDDVSLQQHRKLTIPFIKEILASST